MTKARRSGKVFLDWSQNSGSKTTISPYSLRGRERPTVAALYGIDYFSVETVVKKSEVNRLIPLLKAAGAEDILELPIAKIIR